MLTEHFSYNEMTRSAWAERNGVDNTPDALQLLALENLCQVLLEPLRQQFGPIETDNLVSKHLSGEAVDIRIPDVETGRAYYRWILRHVDFDQLLFEYRRDGAMWLHCSVLLDKRENRHQAFPNYKV